jgi:hypothetical protein
MILFENVVVTINFYPEKSFKVKIGWGGVKNDSKKSDIIYA